MKLFITFLAIAAMAMADDANQVEETLNTANNQFTAKMFNEVVKSNPDKSVVLSAFSVLTPLSLLGLASEGETHNELVRATGLPNENVTKEVFTLVNDKLRSLKGVDLRMANRVYIPNEFVLNDNFAAVSRDVFGSEVKNVDFTKNTETAAEINAWVESQTNNRIKNLVDPMSLDSDTRAVLVNALYFKGKWQDQFDKNATTERDFHVSKDKTIKLPTMNRKGHYRYAESAELNAKLLELPYEGRESSFLIILPNEIDGLTALEEKLKDPTALAKATENLNGFEVDVYLPKFKIETTTNLKDVLEKLDVKKVFTRDAKLNNLLKDQSGMYVSEAIQKAFIEVNEEGAEAAAANVFVGLGAALNTPEKKVFQVDRPFYYELRTYFGVTKEVAIVNGVMAVKSK